MRVNVERTDFVPSQREILGASVRFKLGRMPPSGRCKGEESGAMRKQRGQCGSKWIGAGTIGKLGQVEGKTIQFETIHGSFPLTNPYGDHQR